MTYNTLWCAAFNYASNTSMTSHRTTQFADDYAQAFEGESIDEVCQPAEFIAWAAAHDFHYHDHK